MIKLLLLVSILPSFLDHGPHTALWGVRHHADAEVNYQVVDSQGKPVQDAYVNILFRIDYPHNKIWEEQKRTDANGFVQAKARLNHSICIDIYKEGFYPSEDQILVYKTKANPPILNRKWQPYGITKKVILKKIRNPVKMRRYEWIERKIPIFDQWCALDLEKFMWLPPYGEGVYADILIKCNSRIGGNCHRPPYTQTLEISFTNNPYAGFYLHKKELFSNREFIYSANTNATFLTSRCYTHQSKIFAEKEQDQLHEDEYLVIRTRTKVNPKGELTSAHYGILSGGFSFYDEISLWGTFFNPNENDPNLEDLTTAERAHRSNKIVIERDFKGVK